MNFDKCLSRITRGISSLGRMIFLENRSPLRKIEYLFIAILFVNFMILFRNVLFLQTRMFTHDTIWYYGLIQDFYSHISNGVFPYWDPFDYCGQPMFYNLGIARLFEIPTLGLIFFNKFLNISYLTLYHWDFIIRIFIVSWGVYLCFRETNRYLFSNWIVLISFLFSSFSFASMWQCGLLTTFMWVPWIVFFVLRASKNFSLYNLVGFAFFLGLVLTSYQAEYVITYLSLFLVSFLITKPQRCLKIFGDRKQYKKMLVALLIIIGLGLQVLAVFLEKNTTVPLMRQIDTSINAKDDFRAGYAKSGVSSVPADFAGLLIPDIAVRYWQGNTGRHFSEGPLYIGLVPLLLVVLGLMSKETNKPIFLFTLGVIIFLMLGGKYILGKFSVGVFPFLRYAHHMQLFQPFFIFSLLYFLGQGADYLVVRLTGENY